MPYGKATVKGGRANTLTKLHHTEWLTVETVAMNPTSVTTARARARARARKVVVKVAEKDVVVVNKAVIRVHLYLAVDMKEGTRM